MQTVSLADETTVSLAPSITVSCSDPDVPQDQSNLAYQAAELLRRRHSHQQGAAIDIQKRIPVAAGLAGGSGNAAAALRALNELWNLGCDESRLMEYAAELGSDVPFCMTGGTAIASGRGEKIEPLDVACPGVFPLVTPPCQVSSAWAYQNLKIGLTKPDPVVNLVVCALQKSDTFQLVSNLWNDLESPVLEAFPIVKRVKQVLAKAGASGVTMSGSGPTVFGIAGDIDMANEIAEKVRRAGRDWQINVCHPLRRVDVANGNS